MRAVSDSQSTERARQLHWGAAWRFALNQLLPCNQRDRPRAALETHTWKAAWDTAPPLSFPLSSMTQGHQTFVGIQNGTSKKTQQHYPLDTPPVWGLPHNCSMNLTVCNETTHVAIALTSRKLRNSYTIGRFLLLSVLVLGQGRSSGGSISY
jgi:hypothetical protein